MNHLHKKKKLKLNFENIKVHDPRWDRVEQWYSVYDDVQVDELESRHRTVTFPNDDSLCETKVIEQWPQEHWEARCGNWQKSQIDRMIFQMRIAAMEAILSPTMNRINDQ